MCFPMLLESLLNLNLSPLNLSSLNPINLLVLELCGHVKKFKGTNKTEKKGLQSFSYACFVLLTRPLGYAYKLLSHYGSRLGEIRTWGRRVSSRRSAIWGSVPWLFPYLMRLNLEQQGSFQPSNFKMSCEKELNKMISWTNELTILVTRHL